MLMRAAALALLGGCSFAFVDAPPPPCTTSSVAPIADVAIATIAAIGIIYFATSDGDNAELGMLVEGGLAAGFGASAYTGFQRVSRCKGA
jgi:hypothetical protein